MKWNSTWDFALFSANLHRYLPSISWDVHPMIYQQYKDYHQPRTLYDRAAWVTNMLDPHTTAGPRILCLYHLGYHAQIPCVLADKGLLFDVLLDRKVFEEQRELLEDMRDSMNRHGDVYRFLFSDNPSVLLQVRTALGQGRHLVVFADGNSGVNTVSADKLKVDFLESSIAVRKGIALISHLMKIPVIPISHRVQGLTMELVVGAPIVPIDTPRNEYIVTCMQALYGFLSGEISVEPWMWESWSYLHELNAFDEEESFQTVPAVADCQEALLPIKIAGQKGYFDRLRYLFCYEMPTGKK